MSPQRPPSPQLYTEETPLLLSVSEEVDSNTPTDDLPAYSDRDVTPWPSRKTSPSFVALVLFLCASLITILLVGFFAPAAASKYAKEALVLDVTSLSVDSLTDHGVRVRIQATIKVDAKRVTSSAVRSLGRAGTWMVRNVSTDVAKINVYLPDYAGGLLGTATAPPMVIRVRNGQTTELDFVSDVELGSREVIRNLANDYLTGRLGRVRVLGVADLSLRSGLLNFGAQKISEEVAFEELPSLPEFKVQRMDLREVIIPGQTALSVNVSCIIQNRYPLEIEVPSLSFAILLSGCEMGDLVHVATAETSYLLVRPRTDIGLGVSGVVRTLPKDLITACPQSRKSPMDRFLGGYLHGKDTVVYVQGLPSPGSGAPIWLLEFLQSVTLPVPFPKYTFDNIVKSFSLSHVDFKLPIPDAPPGSPEASPRLSASIGALIRLPDGMNYPLNVKRLKATTDVIYEGAKFGTLDLRKWIPAESSRSDKKYLLVQAEVEEAPLEVTDYAVFEKVVQRVVHGNGKPLVLGINGEIDADINTSLGDFVVRNISAAGNITIDALPSLGSLPQPRVNEIIVDSTTPQSVTLRANISVENPTPWAASIPYMNVHIAHKGFILGNASVFDAHILPGNNTLIVEAVWDPRAYGGRKAEKIGTQLLSEYISGRKTTVAICPHANSLPSMPMLSIILSKHEVTVPTPRAPGGSPGDPSPHFIESATMHIWSSTADFLISNPLRDDELIIESVNGTAEYNGSELGMILTDRPFAIRPAAEGKTITPKLPVTWKLHGVGFAAMKKALGGSLDVRAEALCSIRIGELQMEVFYNSSETIGANIRLT